MLFQGSELIRLLRSHPAGPIVAMSACGRFVEAHLSPESAIQQAHAGLLYGQGSKTTIRRLRYHESPVHRKEQEPDLRYASPRATADKTWWLESLPESGARIYQHRR